MKHHANVLVRTGRMGRLTCNGKCAAEQTSTFSYSPTWNGEKGNVRCESILVRLRTDWGPTLCTKKIQTVDPSQLHVH